MTLAQFQRFNFYPGVALIYETAWRPGLHVPRENSKTTENILTILVAITGMCVKNVISSQDIKQI